MISAAPYLEPNPIVQLFEVAAGYHSIAILVG